MSEFSPVFPCLEGVGGGGASYNNIFSNVPLLVGHTGQAIIPGRRGYTMGKSQV